MRRWHNELGALKLKGDRRSPNNDKGTPRDSAAENYSKPLVHNGHTQIFLDIDSDELSAFDQTDQNYLELIVATIAKENFSNANLV
jgi:hypothetical protein